MVRMARDRERPEDLTKLGFLAVFHRTICREIRPTRIMAMRGPQGRLGRLGRKRSVGTGAPEGIRSRPHAAGIVKTFPGFMML